MVEVILNQDNILDFPKCPHIMHLVDRGTYTNGKLWNASWSLLSAKTIHVQVFIPVLMVVLAAEGKLVLA